MGQLIVNRTLYDQLVELGDELAQLLTSVNTGEGALGRMIRDEELYDRLLGTVTSLDSVTAMLASSPEVPTPPSSSRGTRSAPRRC